MHELIDQAKKELKGIKEKGLSLNNLEAAGELTDIIKDIYEIEKCEAEKEKGYSYERYNGNYGQYNDSYGRYNDGYGRYEDNRYREGGQYNGYGTYDNYGARGGGGNYRGYDDRGWRRSGAIEKPFEYMMEDIEDGVVTYHEGRGRMRYGAADDKTLDGLEKMMHGISALVDATMGMAQTEQEKEIVRKHLQKLKSM